MQLPDAVLGLAARGPDQASWVERLPGLVDALLADWRLRLDGTPRPGSTALVLPVRAETGPAVLKVGFAHPGADHEHLALRHWDGRGAARLLRADPRRGALLLERLEDRSLVEEWDLEACRVVAALYANLHIPAFAQLRRLGEVTARWTDHLEALPRSAPLPRRLVEQAVALGRELAADPATEGTVVHGDLHYAHVLAAPPGRDPQPWLAIDPAPLRGDPHFEPAPMLLHRVEELGEGGALGVRQGVRMRFHTLVDEALLDEDRARAWVVLRSMVSALGRLRAATRPSAADHDWLTTCVTVAKAVQD